MHHTKGLLVQSCGRGNLGFLSRSFRFQMELMINPDPLLTRKLSVKERKMMVFCTEPNKELGAGKYGTLLATHLC